MKGNVESSLKRFLKRKVKITLGLVVVFLITGTVGFGATEGSLTPDESGNINYKVVKDKSSGNYIVNSEEISAEGKIKLELEADFTTGSNRDELSGIYTGKNKTTNITAGNGIEINVENKGTVGISGIGKGGSKAVTNLTTEEGDIKISSKGVTNSNGIRAVNETVNLTAKNGDINIETVTKNGAAGTDPFGMANSSGIYNAVGNVTLNSNNIFISSSAEGEDSHGIFSDESGITSLNAKNKIVIKSESKMHGATGVDSREFFGSKGKNVLNAEEILVEVSASERETDDGKNSAYAVYSHGGINYLTATGENGITLTAKVLDGANGIYGQQSAENILKAEKGNIKIITESIDGGSSGIRNDNNSVVKLDSGADIILNTVGREISYGIYSNKSKADLISENIFISTESKDGQSSGLYFADSDADITSGKDISVSSIGKGTSYGIASFNGNADLDMTAQGDITSYAKSETGTSYGLYASGKEADISGNDIEIVSESSKGKSYGMYSNTVVNMTAGDRITISAKSDSENTYGTYLLGGETNISGNSIGIISESGRGAYGIYTMNKNNMTVTGNTYVKVSGREINEERDMTPEQIEKAKEALAKGNNTITKIFTDANLNTGAVTQGIRANNSKLTFNGDVMAESSDTAMTSIGKSAEITINGGGMFTGNDYLIEQGEETARLIARPVIQALDGGSININGETFIGSLTTEKDEADRISNVGVYAHGSTDIDETEGLTSEININGDTTVVSDIALMATAGGHIHINTEEGENSQSTNKGNVILDGDIVAGKHKSSIDIAGESVNINGEIIAGNGGSVTVDLTTGNSEFTGRADDYFDIEENLGGEFRNEKYGMDITEDGTVTINIDKGNTWNVEGQSYVTNLKFGEDSGNINIKSPDGTNSSLSVQTISGNGIFNISLNAEDKEKGAMLYIYDAKEENLQHTVNVFSENILELEAGEELRFATLGKGAKDKGTSFAVNDILEEGIKDVSFETKYEDYSLADKDNEIYNGDKTTEDKPGNEVIDENYGNGENWFLTKDKEKEEVNDGGQTIIEMSRANYASAVYMDNLNKRLGDMSFADGDEGFWVRERNDRVGEDSEYRLINYMTQLGYDRKSLTENGVRHRGIAVEFTTGDMEFKNIKGEADIERRVISLYETKVYNNGFYSDYVVRAGKLDNEFDINGRQTGNQVTGSYDNLFAGAGAEYGYRMNINEKWYFEPQAQVQYTYINSEDYVTNQNTQVELSEIHSIIGRAGFRFGYDRYVEGNKTAAFYAKADINHEFMGEQEVRAFDKTGSIKETYENDGTWYDVGIGVTSEINESVNVYADVERQFGRTKDSNSWQFNLGFRYKF